MDATAFENVELEDMNPPAGPATDNVEETNTPLQMISDLLNVSGPVGNLMTGICPDGDEAQDMECDDSFLPPPVSYSSAPPRWYRTPFGHTFCLLLWMSYLFSAGGISLVPVLEPTTAPEDIIALKRLKIACWIIYTATTLVLFVIASSLRRFYPPYDFPRSYLATTIFVQTVALPYILSSRSTEWTYSYAFTTQAVISVFVELCLHKSKFKKH